AGGFLFGAAGIVALVFVVIGFFVAAVGCTVRRGRRHAEFLGRDFLVGETGEDFAHAALAVEVQVVFFQQQADGPREAGQRGLHLRQAFLDALGDRDFAFARQEFDRTHFAHVHAHRVGGAADFGVHGGQQRDRFFGGGFVIVGADPFGTDRVGVGC